MSVHLDAPAVLHVVRPRFVRSLTRRLEKDLHDHISHAAGGDSVGGGAHLGGDAEREPVPGPPAELVRAAGVLVLALDVGQACLELVGVSAEVLGSGLSQRHSDQGDDRLLLGPRLRAQIGEVEQDDDLPGDRSVDRPAVEPLLAGRPAADDTIGRLGRPLRVIGVGRLSGVVALVLSPERHPTGASPGPGDRVGEADVLDRLVTAVDVEAPGEDEPLLVIGLHPLGDPGRRHRRDGR